jgi:hypothetical protein
VFAFETTLNKTLKMEIRSDFFLIRRVDLCLRVLRIVGWVSGALNAE